MAGEAFLEVATTAWQTDAVAKHLEGTEGVDKVVRVDKDSGKLVVAIQQGAREQVLREIGHISGVIHAE